MSTPTYGMGRIATKDERDKKFPLRALLAPAPTVPEHKYWRTGPVLDQGQTSMCVGFASRQFLTSSPVPDKGGPTPQAIYAGAQSNDEWPGEAYDGTSDRGAMKYLQSLGYVTAYHWTANADEAAAYVLTQGGVLIGISWYEGMLTPDKHGVIHPTGRIVGGHELFVSGMDRRRGRFRLTNSWSRSWGDNGRCWLLGEDLQKLMDADGDCCAPTQRVPDQGEAS